MPFERVHGLAGYERIFGSLLDCQTLFFGLRLSWLQGAVTERALLHQRNVSIHGTLCSESRYGFPVGRRRGRHTTCRRTHQVITRVSLVFCATPERMGGPPCANVRGRRNAVKIGGKEELKPDVLR
jgi:hypothetical protein